MKYLIILLIIPLSGVAYADVSENWCFFNLGCADLYVHESVNDFPSNDLWKYTDREANNKYYGYAYLSDLPTKSDAVWLSTNATYIQQYKTLIHEFQVHIHDRINHLDRLWQNPNTYSPFLRR